MDRLDGWGDSVPHHEQNVYELDWGWNQIDEAPVHLGLTHFWPHFEGVVVDFFLMKLYNNGRLALIQ